MNCLCMIICGLALFVNFWIPIMKRWWMLSKLNSAFSLTLFLDDLLLTRFKLRINLMLLGVWLKFQTRKFKTRRDVWASFMIFFSDDSLFFILTHQMRKLSFLLMPKNSHFRFFFKSCHIPYSSHGWLIFHDYDELYFFSSQM